MEYIVKAIATATEDNPNFAGEKHVYYIGKGTNISSDTKWCVGWKHRRFAEDYVRKEKKWTSENERFWKYQYEILAK